ncbi:MAG: hypothetical protein FRX48_03421 [Lasallia pustulata]|uniref:Uncharacterized protein n=1 Tax=Lasallia pustulata TaxID=136370 RepID=A0A5M8PUU8_9LECA|nr:MAG: hypothetical protein FRX48_03421 [Lasallia pustulata]
MLLKNILIPLWILQQSLLIAIVVATLVIANTIIVNLKFESPSLGTCIALGCFSTICFFLTAIEIILFIQHQLQPLTYLISQSIKTALWIVVVLVSVRTLHKTLLHWREKTIIWFLVGGLSVELGSFVVTLLYAFLVYSSIRHETNSNEAAPLLGSRGRDRGRN